MPPELEWKINDMCEFKNPNDNRWYLGKIINQDLIELVIEIPELMQQWKVIIQHCNGFLQPLYNIQELLANHKTINPITDGERLHTLKEINMLEGLFGTIRELGGDSSTHTLKSYGYSLNKYQLFIIIF
ncbi:945_t:CDS:2 [Diversispora eburnea]|uniref:945_t:CDS:1 n=1 Tax=Diversispora eburnea TaxID=1213867 RepID=A0A9N9BDP7_9GLOM|nr:945_t:CDS:2 [Diversispora eburnea]